MPTFQRVNFRECALVSGLVTQADIDQALTELRLIPIGASATAGRNQTPAAPEQIQLASSIPVSPDTSATGGSSMEPAVSDRLADKATIVGKSSQETAIAMSSQETITAQLSGEMIANSSDETIIAKPSRQLANKLIEMGRLNSYQADQLLNGRTKFDLGPYRILDSIAQGGMGEVYKAEHSMMGRIVAVKVLPRHKSTPEAIKSFTREIRVQAKLDHENLVRAFDAGHEGNVYFLVSEYIPGTDLRRYVRNRGPLGMREAATIISQASAGLQHAHDLGLIHRDVKPGNILVTPDGQTKLSDLGLAGWLTEGEDSLHPGKTVGTADYLPPEQIMSPGAIIPAGDIYSLGCTLYYAVTGKVPYAGGTTRQKAHRHCTDTAMHPRTFNRTLSDPFLEVLAAMLERDPTKRIQSASEVIERLAPWAGKTVPAPGEPDITAGVPPRANPQPPINPLEDTAARFVDPVRNAGVDAPSQTSDRTDPIASAEQETLPEIVFYRLSQLGSRMRSRLSSTTRNASPLVFLLAILAPITVVGILLLLIAMLRG